MRLAVFTNEFPTRRQTYFLRDMQSLLEAGCDIDIFPVRPIDESQWSDVSFILEKRHLQKIKVHYFNPRFSTIYKLLARDVFRQVMEIGCSALTFGIVPFAKSLIVILQALLLVKLNREKYDHVLSYWGNYAATYAFLFHKWSNLAVPFSLFVHAGIDLYRDQVYLDKKMLYADNILTVCEFNRSYIKTLYPDLYPKFSQKISLHQLGLDLQTYSFNWKGRESTKILTVGHLDKRKGDRYLFSALGELKRQGQKFTLDVIGNGPETSVLKKLAQELDIADRVSFSGWLTIEQVRKKMQGATLLVHPSSCIGDAVPTVIKEAMALGLPVIASNVAGIPELLGYGRCGVLVPPANVPALKDALQLLLNSADERAKFAREARQYTESMYDLKVTGTRLAQKIFSSSSK